MTSRIFAIVCAATFTLLPCTALAWNAGTHAYVAGHLLHRKAPPVAELQLMRDRMYGSNGPDLFNYAFSEPYFTIADYLHEYVTPDATLLLWKKARASHDPELLAYAQGFVSHDNAFGADATAHIDGLTRPGKQGYVIEKATLLAAELQALLEQNGVSLTAEQVQTGAHVLVEAAVDLLVQAQLDPQIGAKLLDATQNADPGAGLILVTAYQKPLAQYFEGGAPEAAATIQYTESVFRSINVLYAQALAASRPEDYAPLTQFNAGLAAQLFGLPSEAVVPIVSYGIGRAMQLARDDFAWEMLATIAWVNWNLAARNVLP
jgi:hypothetical protein